MARTGIYLSVSAENPRRIRRVGCRATVPDTRHPRYRSQGRAVRRSPEGCVKACTMQAIRQGMHAGTAYWRTYGFYRGFMRSILQLRTPEGSSSGDKHQLSGLNGRSTVESISSAVRFRDPQIEMAHGAGGKASRRLVEGLFAPILFESSGAPLGDAAHVTIDGSCVAITTDSFVVKPLRFPGGSIGELAVNGTMNDLAVSGAKGQAMVVTFVLEEGLPTAVLEGEVRAMAAALRRAGIAMVGGDTKVVERGKADGMYITTTGIGQLMPQVTIDARSIRPGDKVILSGPIGDHG